MECERVLQLIATVRGEFTADKKKKLRLETKIPFEKSYMVNNKKISDAKTFPHF